jgi:hypothetical protein
MATIQIKRSELRRLIQEGVKPIAEAWAEKHKQRNEASANTIREMVKDALEEAFGESGDHNGAHVGGTFGDGGVKEGPIAEGMFSNIGNKVAAGVGMRGKEKKELEELESAYRFYKDTNGSNDAVQLNAMDRLINLNAGQHPRAELYPQTWQNWFKAFEEGNLRAMKNLAEKLGMDVTPLNSLQRQILMSKPQGGHLWVDSKWASGVRSLIQDVQNNISVTLESAYKKKVQELSAKLGRETQQVQEGTKKVTFTTKKTASRSGQKGSK